MIIPKPSDVQHKYYLLRLLRAILADKDLRIRLQFKGGTYASLRGVLDRFSVDLDFDLPEKSEIKKIRSACEGIFHKLGLQIKDESQNYLQFFLRYPAGEYKRNTLKLEINDSPSIKNMYEKVYLQELNMYCSGQTLETMMANKLVAAMARFDRNKKIAGRDFYDLHQFFLAGCAVRKEVVEDLTSMSYVKYLKKLIRFIQGQVTERLLNQDLNPLLETDKLNQVLKILKPELISLIEDEIKRS
ncbi:MAG: nucleotidyl transferase AbiEii/AbiGii toxin family protein [Patescibacteria group bacterium]|nr:nucleotidyl transferase AbiEii/AbiGii toxin family protein [Patescibacteria group bacterium]